MSRIRDIFVPLTRDESIAFVPVWDRGLIAWAMVDADDWEAVDWRWFLYRGYAAQKSGGRWLWLHRQVMGEPEGIVDHRNGNPLDNRRENLRVTDQRGNARNRPKGAISTSKSRIRNVAKRGGRWIVRVKADGIQHWGGSFDTVAEAEAAAEALRKRLFGEGYGVD